MSREISEHDLIGQAVTGDRIALQRLLVRYSDQLQRHVASKLPKSVQGSVGVEDVVQQVLISVYQHIHGFDQRVDATFWGWLKTIANNRVNDALRAEHRKKRGGEFRRTSQAIDQSGSLEDVVNLLSAGSHSPSKSVARHDAVRAVQQVIEDLPDDYRQAVQFRLLEGKSLDEVAALMDRSPRSVQGLVDRAKKKMRAALGRLSLYQ